MTSSSPPLPALGPPARSAAELAFELRREFERALFERYGQPPGQDPVLAALFHAAAVQLARVYDEAEQVFPEAVFDDLVSGLGMPPRAATPAQTVVEFAGADEPELVSPEYPIVGINSRGEYFTFTLDVPIRIGPSRLVFAGAIEDGRLSTVPGACLPDLPTAPGAPPTAFPGGVVELGGDLARSAPTLVLAFDAAEAHLSGLGVFVDVPLGDQAVARALARSAWQLLDDGGPAGGVARESLVLRARSGPGGVQLLDWVHDADPMSPEIMAAQPAVPALAGPYGELCWVWPEVPPHRRVRSRAPRAIADAVAQLAPAEYAAAYERPLAWVQLALPAGTRGVAAAVQRVVAPAMSASNVEAYTERVNVGELGRVATFRPDGARERHPLAVLSVTGEQGGRYVEEPDATAPIERGRYRERDGDLEVHPARGPTGRFDRYVMAQLLYTDGARANGLQPGEIAGRGTQLANASAAVLSVVPSRAGSAPPTGARANVRFAELLRTRERVVSAADYEIVARSFEPRIVSVRVGTQLAGGPDGVPRRCDAVAVRVRADDFADPAGERPRLAAALERHLQARVALGTLVRVEIDVDEPAGA